MTTGYYAYIIGDDGHVKNRIDVLCDDDKEAKRCAEQLVDGHDIELWQEARRIATFPKKPGRHSEQPKECPRREVGVVRLGIR